MPAKERAQKANELMNKSYQQILVEKFIMFIVYLHLLLQDQELFRYFISGSVLCSFFTLTDSAFSGIFT